MAKNYFEVFLNAWEKSFPLLPKIRSNFWGLLLFCGMFLAIQLTQTEKMTVAVTAVKGNDYSTRQITHYTRGSIELGGHLVIKDPSIAERLLLNDIQYEVNPVTLLLLMIASVIMIVIVPKVYQQNLFRKDISLAIRLLGYLTMIHALVNFYIRFTYTPKTIEALTNHEFTLSPAIPFLICAEFYFALVILALAGFYKRGIKLQQEQDLTV
jgi:hypothetical protein